MLSSLSRRVSTVALACAAGGLALGVTTGPARAIGRIVAGRAATPAISAPLVRTSNGPVIGTVFGNENAYLGIPYAAPPVGSLRWEPPVPHARWTAPVQATAFGPHCPQPATPFGKASLSEDCLFLNVFTPSQGTVERNGRPVMVWIHGGAFTVGESDDYDPTRLIARGVDVVTINYRLGALGFLAHPALDSEGHVFANYGLLDQQAALQWVRRNAAAFGGDPSRVTIFGESAGGASVLSQLASPLARNDFTRAIIESGAYVNTPTTPAAEADGTAYATAEGCTNQTAACLRGLSVLQVLTQESSGYQPTIDGTVLRENPKTAVATGRFSHVPVMNGSNGEEFRLFTALDFDFVTGPITPATYPLALAAEVGAAAAGPVAAQYPVSAYPSADLANSAALTDGEFACNALFLDRSLSQYVPTYGYEFSDVNAPELFLPPDPNFPYEAAHASEIQYLWVLAGNTVPLSAQQQRLSKSMVDYWTSFARFGNPRAGNSIPWFAFGSGSGNLTMLDTPRDTAFTGFDAEHQCGFWNVLLNPASATSTQSTDHRRPAIRAR